MEENELPFRRAPHCQGCQAALGPDRNWTCVRGIMPVAGMAGFMVELHTHTHLACADGILKMMALRTLGLRQRENN